MKDGANIRAKGVDLAIVGRDTIQQVDSLHRRISFAPPFPPMNPADSYPDPQTSVGLRSSIPPHRAHG